MKLEIFFLAILISISTMNLKAQEIVKLWEHLPPTDSKLDTEEVSDSSNSWLTNVSVPELQIYKAEENKDGMAIVVCPGGGYAGLAIGHEGKLVAEWLNSRGITAIVLKYRMPNKNSKVPIEDGHQAMRYVRNNAKKIGINPNKVGILGFSAGGHLASTISTHYATEGTSTRPDFSILFYPVITMNTATHGGSRTNLLGDKPSEADIHRFSNEEQVTVNTPPTILLLSDDDKSVPTYNSVKYYEALNRNNIPATMYIFPEGGHGWGFKQDFKYYKQMTSLLAQWLDDL